MYLYLRIYYPFTLLEMANSEQTFESKYGESGVNVDKNEKVVSIIKNMVESTHSEEMRMNPLCKLGSFSGIFPIPSFLNESNKLGFHLTATMDGVGTKSELVKQHLGDKGFVNLGHDIVNHCINDTLAGGGKPLFFLDYFASSNLDVKLVCNFVSGIVEACKIANVALIGGETAEMPGIYREGKSDLVGCMIGYQLTSDAVMRLDNPIKSGDIIIGFPSNGLHTNGYSAIRKALKDSKVWQNWTNEQQAEFLGICCRSHLSYLDIYKELEEANIFIKSSIHITGGGWLDNPPRILSDDLSIEFKWDDWQTNHMPKFFHNVKEITDMVWSEMLHVFNCGIGLMIVISKENYLNKINTLKLYDLGGFHIGNIVSRSNNDVIIFTP